MKKFLNIDLNFIIKYIYKHKKKFDFIALHQLLHFEQIITRKNIYHNVLHVTLSPIF